MSVYRRWLLAVLTAFWITLMGAIWASFAPIQAGGGAAYVVIIGDSMEPNFQLGDLVIVQRASEYTIGDVVAYRNQEIGNNVFHRIIDIQHNRYILQGDNNSWIDSYQPFEEDLIGKLWVHLPGGGLLLQDLRHPQNMALLAGTIGGLLAASLLLRQGKNTRYKKGYSTRERSGFIINNISVGNSGYLSFLGGIKEKLKNLRKTNIPPVDSGPSQNRNPNYWGIEIEGVFFILGLIAFVSLLLGIFAFTRPATRLVPDDISYQHLGFFTYSGSAPTGIYDSDTVSSGEPIFPNLTCNLEVRFNYTLLAENLQDAGGTHQLTAILSEPQSGWKRSIPLQEKTSFRKNTFDTNATMDLCQIVDLIHSVERETEFRPSSYTLSITPLVSATGTIADRVLKDDFQPNLTFKYNRTHFYLLKDDPEHNPLNPIENGLLRKESEVANVLPIFGLEPKVPVLRLFSLVGLSLSLIGMGMISLRIQRVSRQDQSALVRMKYGPLLVEVEENRPTTIANPIRVASIDDLAKLAERYNTMILHQSVGRWHDYYVQGDTLAYRYSLMSTKTDQMRGGEQRISAELRQASQQNEFRVYYQPVISLPDGGITTVEALLRWQHPEKGLIPAEEFIRAAESAGLLDQLDERALQMACSQLKEWQAAGVDLKLSVNLSERNLLGSTHTMVEGILKTTAVEPHSLQIEVPESCMIEHYPQLLPQLRALKEMGIAIVVDDFTGQSPLAPFGQIPISGIKFDRLYTQKNNQPEEVDSLKKMIDMAMKLGLNVIAKGVETEAQKAFYEEHSCPQAQGFLFGYPIPAESVPNLWQERKPVTRSKTRKKRS